VQQAILARHEEREQKLVDFMEILVKQIKESELEERKKEREVNMLHQDLHKIHKLLFPLLMSC